MDDINRVLEHINCFIVAYNTLLRNVLFVVGFCNFLLEIPAGSSRGKERGESTKIL